MGSQTSIQRRFTYQELLPLANPEFAFEMAFPCAFPPSSTINQGTLLLAPVAVGTTAVQTLAITGSPTGGTVTIAGTNPITGYAWTTATIPYTFGDAAVAAAINAVINGPSGAIGLPSSVTVASGAVTFAGDLANYPVPLMTLGTNALTGGTTPTMTVTNTTPGVAPGTASPYLGTSGSPVFIARYTIITDASGDVFFGSQASGIENGQIDLSAAVYTRGLFDSTLLSILDTNAITKLGARFLSGGLTAGPGSTPLGALYIP